MAESRESEIDRLRYENSQLRKTLEDGSLRQEEEHALLHRDYEKLVGELEHYRDLMSDMDRSPLARSTPAHSSRHMTTVIDRPVSCILPEKFSGERNEDWEDWISLFETYSSLNKWTQEEQVTILATLLRGRARKAWLDIPVPERKKYDSVKQCMHRALVPLGVSEIKKTELHTLRRNPSDSIQDFASELRRTVRLTYPELSSHSIDVLSKDFLINKIEDRQLRLKLRHQSKVPYDELVSIAVEWETIERLDRARSTVHSGVSQTTSEPDIGFQEQLKLVQQNLSSLQSQISKISGSIAPSRRSRKGGSGNHLN